jgi:hypothetical protein
MAGVLPPPATKEVSIMATELAEVNLGKIDRAARVTLGVAVITYFLLAPVTALVGLAGLVIALTGFIGFCPAYALFGMSSRRKVA